MALPQELIVVEGARQIRSDRRRDAGIEVLYVADYPFPATGLIERIGRALPSQRWHPLTEDWLNPGAPTSHQNGWQPYIDGRKRPNTLVHAWSAQWKDDEGNLVLYHLIYRSRHDDQRPMATSPDNSKIEVAALWLPASTVNAMQKAVRSAEPVTR